jgi:hypothetical protein
MCKSFADKECQEFELTQNQLIAIAEYKRIPMLRVRDKRFYYVSLADWQLLIAEVLPTLPKYIEDRCDCDNIAAIFHGRFVERYALNSMGEVSIPAQKHVINLFPAEIDGLTRLYFVEPQTGHIEPFHNEVEWKAGEWEMY